MRDIAPFLTAYAFLLSIPANVCFPAAASRLHVSRPECGAHTAEFPSFVSRHGRKRGCTSAVSSCLQSRRSKPALSELRLNPPTCRVRWEAAPAASHQPPCWLFPAATALPSLSFAAPLYTPTSSPPQLTPGLLYPANDAGRSAASLRALNGGTGGHAAGPQHRVLRSFRGHRTLAPSFPAPWLLPVGPYSPPAETTSLWATKKGGGSTKNGRDSHPKYLGVKKFGGEFVLAGHIVVRQRGTRYKAGDGVRLCRDDSLTAIRSGYVDFMPVYKFENHFRKRRWLKRHRRRIHAGFLVSVLDSKEESRGYQKREQLVLLRTLASSWINGAAFNPSVPSHHHALAPGDSDEATVSDQVPEAMMCGPELGPGEERHSSNVSNESVTSALTTGLREGVAWI
ncbi:ribosomal protein RPL27 [Besnoitia besnoiti]|uniref:Ribosomal protein RPL27 n=1 Tax=Besnoitia besnoiti TaxID=94643 RepID=A0A2A9M3L5_BESBE|nr:ribosomal protein RPL27 [Besnoitia besnoiti]PFH33078.1 ribosomal protein RPL27 [Besnoitia besnoiti]